MLKLTRRAGEALLMTGAVKVTVLEIMGYRSIRVAISAPRNVPINRESVYQRKIKEPNGIASGSTDTKITTITFEQRQGDSIRIGHGIQVITAQVRRGQVQIWIEAPEEIRIFREELFKPRRKKEPPNLRGPLIHPG